MLIIDFIIFFVIMKNINKEQYVMRKKINKIIMKRPQGFTLVETLLVVFLQVLLLWEFI